MNDTLIESFDLKNTLTYKRLAPITVKKMLINFYGKLYPDVDPELYLNEMKNIGKGYLIHDVDEILLFTVDNKTSLEYHFVNLSQLSDRGQTNSLGKSSNILLSTIIKIILDNLNTAKEIHIRAEESRVKLYSKIIDLILKRHEPNWEVKGFESVIPGVKNIILKSKRISSPVFERLFNFPLDD